VVLGRDERSSHKRKGLNRRVDAKSNPHWLSDFLDRSLKSKVAGRVELIQPRVKVDQFVIAKLNKHFDTIERVIIENVIRIIAVWCH